MIAGKTVAEIVAMSNRKRHLWYKTITPEEKATAMMLVKAITKEMSNEIESCKDYFHSRTKDGHIIYYLNGFIGVGIFETPQSHLSEGNNTIWMYGVGFNGNANAIVENINIEMTLDEAEDHHRTLGICIEKFKRELLEEAK